ncbi:hypothetical protein [Streptomyces griseorubiginosus]|uniref:hypothetical protein n=1 Tax=Streptomyces griseorubiginosus TaxID=67304 RepID=UPI003658A724
MHWVLMGLAVLAMTVVAAGGVAGITTGWVLFMAGLLIQSRSHRPGRVPADPTRTSS